MAQVKKDKFKVTEEMIAKANDYIPLARKKAIAKATAEACLEEVDRITADIATETQLPLPQLYREECGAKPLYLMYFFLNDYLRLDIGDELSEEDYDYYASSHIFNQLERFKSGEKGTKDKVFDILYDYKQLKQMLETEIYNLKESKNNSLERVQSYMDLFASPNNIKQLNNLLQKTIADTEVAQKKLAEKRATATISQTETVKPKTKPTEKK